MQLEVRGGQIETVGLRRIIRFIKIYNEAFFYSLHHIRIQIGISCHK